MKGSEFDISISKTKVKALISRYLCLCIAAIQFMNVAYYPSKGKSTFLAGKFALRPLI